MSTDRDAQPNGHPGQGSRKIAVNLYLFRGK